MKKLVLSLAIFVALLGTSLLVGHAVHAQGFVPTELSKQYALGSSGINNLIRNIITFVFAIAGLVVLIFIIIAGFQFITSGGDAGKKEEAQKRIVAAVIGLLIIVFSFFIVQLIFALLGLNAPTTLPLPCNNQNQSIDPNAPAGTTPCSSGSSSTTGGAGG